MRLIVVYCDHPLILLISLEDYRIAPQLSPKCHVAGTVSAAAATLLFCKEHS